MRQKIMDHVHQWQVLQLDSTEKEVVWVCSMCSAMERRATIQIVSEFFD